MAKRKGIPYGIMNFVSIREDDCYYEDKTRFVKKIKNANRFFLFTRPQRFGKSLTISMQHHYYNILKADDFRKLYGELYIGEHPTPVHNSYLVIYLNFAVVGADINNYRRSYYIRNGCDVLEDNHYCK